MDAAAVFSGPRVKNQTMPDYGGTASLTLSLRAGVESERVRCAVVARRLLMGRRWTQPRVTSRKCAATCYGRASGVPNAAILSALSLTCRLMPSVHHLWRLQSISKLPTDCFLHEESDGYLLIMRRGDDVVLTERHASSVDAIDRAGELCGKLMNEGWTPVVVPAT